MAKKKIGGETVKAVLDLQQQVEQLADLNHKKKVWAEKLQKITEEIEEIKASITLQVDIGVEKLQEMVAAQMSLMVSQPFLWPLFWPPFARKFADLVSKRQPDWMSSDGLIYLPLDEIKTSDSIEQPPLSPTALYNLAKSIKSNGLRKPLMVYQTDDSYVLVDGYRRYAALQRLRDGCLGYMEENTRLELEELLDKIPAKLVLQTGPEWKKDRQTSIQKKELLYDVLCFHFPSIDEPISSRSSFISKSRERLEGSSSLEKKRLEPLIDEVPLPWLTRTFERLTNRKITNVTMYFANVINKNWYDSETNTRNRAISWRKATAGLAEELGLDSAEE